MKPSFYFPILLVSAGLSFYAFAARAQVTVQWNKTLGDNSHAILSSTIDTNDGDYLATDSNSDNSSFLFKVISDDGYEDYWIAKLDASGNKQWEITIDTDTYDMYTELTSHFATADGGYLLAGRAYNQYFGEYWVVKIDKDGNEAWNNDYGRGYYDFLKDIITTADGGYLLAGDSDNGSHFDYWIVKIDKNGNHQWNKSYGSSGDDHLSSVSSTPDGGYLLTGTLNINIDAEGNQMYDLEVSNFTLLNAETDEEIEEIRDGDVIDLAKLSNTKFSIVAFTDPEAVGSVAFRLEGPFIHGHTENYAPYALFGDKPAGDFSGRLLPPGEYTLVATPYAEKKKAGAAGTPLEISFTIINSDEIEDSQVTGFTLYDAVTNKKIMNLEDGTVIHKDELAHDELTVLMHTIPDFVGSVKVELWGPLSLTRIENTKPYALFRNNSKDLFGEVLPAGEYTLRATPYPEEKAQGEAGMPLEVSFTVVGEDNNNARLAAYPVPTTGVVNIYYQGSAEQVDLMLLDFTGQPLLSLPLQGQTQLDLSSYRKGIYYLKVVDQQGVHLERVVVE